MPSETDLLIAGKLLEVHLTGKLTKEFYEKLAPIVDEQIKQHGKIRILVEMHDFHGWTAGALWEDIKFDMKHWRDIERPGAIVGETEMREAGMAAVLQAVH